MSKQARAFWLILTIAGFTLTAWILSNWRPQYRDLPRLAVYILAALVTSTFKVRLPGVFSSLSVNYVSILAAVADLGPCGILVATAAVLGQTFYKCEKRPQWQHLVFNLATIWLSVAAAHYCLQHRIFGAIDRFGVFSLVGASLVYFAVNTSIISAIIALTSGKKVLAVWKESYLWTSPQYIVGGLVASGLRLLMDYIGWAGVLFTFPVVGLVYRSYTIYLARVDEQQKHIGEIAGLHLRTIEALALAIDAKDDTTSAHVRRVQVYAQEVARELGISAAEMQALEAASLLHDIGKLAVPEQIISKPGRLTPDEFEKMKIHPIVGAEILERVNFPYPVVPIVRAHHEKYDGTGYPEGLKGEEIPVGARILAAVDCLDALASDRQYRKAVPLDEAMRFVASESGKSYDPKVVAVLEARYKELELKAKAESREAAKLSKNVKVARGASPAAGFALPAERATGEDDFRMSISNARREFHTLLEITNDLGRSLSLDETLALLSVRLAKAIPHDALVVWVRKENRLIPRYVKGESYRMFSSLAIPIGQGLSGWVAENNQPIVNGNPAVEIGYLNDASLLTQLRSAISVPLAGQDEVVGVLSLYQLEADGFTADDRRILQSFSGKVGVVIENAVRFEQIQNAAQIDELTGALNARSLFEYLAKSVDLCRHSGGSVAAIVMDLDGFKKANDEHGHLTGNRVLQYVAASLKGLCRPTDVVARLGGDEFVMVVSNPGDGIPNLMDRIARVGQEASAEIGLNTPLGISAGCAVFPNEAADAETLLERADERMYAEKRCRKANPALGNVIMFSKTRAKQVRDEEMAVAAQGL